MAYLTAAELNTHIFPEVMDEIDRGTSDIMDTAIKGAISEAYGFLNRYDRVAIFEAVGDDRNPILLLYVKDIAVWHFINLCSLSIDVAFREKRYDSAMASLLLIQNGKMTPDLPIPIPDDTLPQTDSTIRYGGGRSRNQGFL
jgi:hypothetical protein